MLTIHVAALLVAGFLVVFMQAGFALMETGLCRAKNAAHTMTMLLMVLPLGALAFWLYGFAFEWGNWANSPGAANWQATFGPLDSTLDRGLGLVPAPGHPANFRYPLLGWKGFCLSGVDAKVAAWFFWTMVLFGIAAAIPTGVLVERWRWKNFCLYGLWVALPCSIVANWIWGGGILAKAGSNWGLGHGVVDFAGSGVIHATGGMIGLAGCLLLGPRIGKYLKGRAAPFPAHHLPMVILGTLFLLFGWLGCNAGWALAGGDVRVGMVAVNTLLAAAAGASAAMAYLMARGMKPEPSMLCNGVVAGLVAISAPCAFVDSWAAVLIGAAAGVLVLVSVFFLERQGVDDPVGAISVHGINGLWGMLSLGIFANGKYGSGWNGVVRETFVSRYGCDGVRGLLYGDISQLGAQVLGAAVVAACAFCLAALLFRLSDRIWPMRVSRETELEGLDIPEVGARGYPDFTGAGRG